MSMSQLMSGTPAILRLHEVNATNLTVSGRLTVSGVDVVPGTLTAGELVVEIRRRIQEVEAFCQALSEAIYVGPAIGETAPATFPALRK